MSGLDWVVLIAALAGFVAYGVWRGRGARDLTGFLLADRDLPAGTVLLSVMATQASAITFLSTPGQGYVDGLRFVQFYFGLPFAMVVLCFTAVPIFHRLRVFTAYEYLEQRFDRRTRRLAAGLFLLQRGLAVGLGIYAPSLVLSVLLGWDTRWTCALLGGLAVVYTASGGSKAVGHAHVLQFLVILGAMALALVLLLRALPAGVGLPEATALASRLGRLNPVQTHFDLNDRYNLWSGLIGGFFLQLSYFGTDQSQVGRYLGGQSVRASRLGLLFNGLLKLPMQLAILFLGVLLAVFYLFAPAPLFFNPVETHHVEQGAHGREWRALEQRQLAAAADTRVAATGVVTALHAHDPGALALAERALTAARGAESALRGQAIALLHRADPGASNSDTNYVFLAFVLAVLPAGVVGLVLAAIFGASMNSTSSELNALASTSMVDVVRSLRPNASGASEVWISRLLTLVWAAFAVVFAEYAARLGSLIEAVNILGSLFYGTLLGVFLAAFTLPRVGGRAVFAGALAGEAVVLACFHYSAISFLWYNLIGCAVVMLVALALSPVWPRERSA
ncbi:MAG TPA: sodium:solute symporter [Candidatus Acidoferrales bacterium]|nr:sodium:solute symporter [Candidatus Acidoferrales bacterium]